MMVVEVVYPLSKDGGSSFRGGLMIGIVICDACCNFTDGRVPANNYRFIVRGKTGERDAILRSVAAKRLDKFLTRRRAEEPAGLLFVMPNGSQIISLIDQLNAALRAAGIVRSSFGEKYTVYSLRHFYAVDALRNGVGVFEVARNMGTSVQMIQEYYGKQATPATFATRLGD
jgi:integrase